MTLINVKYTKIKQRRNKTLVYIFLSQKDQKSKINLLTLIKIYPFCFLSNLHEMINDSND